MNGGDTIKFLDDLVVYHKHHIHSSMGLTGSLTVGNGGLSFKSGDHCIDWLLVVDKAML